MATTITAPALLAPGSIGHSATFTAALARLRVSCDGKWPSIPFCCFTDHDPASPAYGASFDLRLPVKISEVRKALARVRANFSRKAA